MYTTAYCISVQRIGLPPSCNRWEPRSVVPQSGGRVLVDATNAGDVIPYALKSPRGRHTVVPGIAVVAKTYVRTVRTVHGGLYLYSF